MNLKSFVCRADETSVEDGGCARYFEVGPEGDEGFFVRIHSWDELKLHDTIRQLEGKMLRITIEVME